MEKIKILMCGLSYKGGGIENFLINYAKKIDNEMFQVDYINSFECAKKEKFYLQLSKKGKMHNIANYRYHPIKFYKELKKINEQENYDIFHYNMNSAAFLVPLIVAKKIGIKNIIAHAHNSSSDKGLLKKVVHFINKHFISCFSNVYFACSEKAAKWFFSKKTIKNKPFFIVNNAIEVDEYKFNLEKRDAVKKEFNINDDTVVLGNIGRLNPQKNHKFLIDIFYNYQKINSNSLLIIIGYGPLEDKLKDKVKRLNMEDKVLFLGERNDIKDLLNMMDIFVLPSHYEGLPVVGVEAQANGLICFFSKNITKEIDITKENKYLILDKNSKVWAQEIDDIYKKININMRQEFYNKVYNSEFNILNASKELEEIYKNLMKRK